MHFLRPAPGPASARHGKSFLALFLLLATLALLLPPSPVHAEDTFVIDFGNGKTVRAGEPVDILRLIEGRDPRFRGQRIIEVIVQATPRSHFYTSHVRLLDERGRLISEARLHLDGTAVLPVHDSYQRPALLVFEEDVYLNRIELVTDRGRRPVKRKGIAIPKKPLLIGQFVKQDYTAEVKRFSVPGGGYSTINFRVRIGEQHAVIVNSIIVLADGRRVGGKTVGTRLSEGDNEFPLDVPEEATDVQVSFAHGKGSEVRVYLLP